MEGHLVALRELTQAPYAASFDQLRQLKVDRRKLYQSYGDDDAVDYTALFVQFDADVIATEEAVVVEVEKMYREARTAVDKSVEEERETRMFKEMSGRRHKGHLLRAMRVRVTEEFMDKVKKAFTARYGAELAVINDERVCCHRRRARVCKSRRSLQAARELRLVYAVRHRHGGGGRRGGASREVRAPRVARCCLWPLHEAAGCCL